MLVFTSARGIGQADLSFRGERAIGNYDLLKGAVDGELSKLNLA
jgi:hypothetical protein